jgi:hypothetical protein
MSEKKPVMQITGARGDCPVCGKPSYSATGMHPQCGVARADALTLDDRKAAAMAGKAKRKSRSKICPKCKHEIPARRTFCGCGYSYSNTSTIANSK